MTIAIRVPKIPLPFAHAIKQPSNGERKHMDMLTREEDRVFPFSDFQIVSMFASSLTVNMLAMSRVSCRVPATAFSSSRSVPDDLSSLAKVLAKSMLLLLTFARRKPKESGVAQKFAKLQDFCSDLLTFLM